MTNSQNTQNNFLELCEGNQVKIKQKLQKLLSESILSFSFVKKDGTVRQSFGCLDDKVISENNATPKPQDPNKPVKPTPVNLVKYFDTEKKAWRSFNIETLYEVMQISANDFFKKVIDEEI